MDSEEEKIEQARWIVDQAKSAKYTTEISRAANQPFTTETYSCIKCSTEFTEEVPDSKMARLMTPKYCSACIQEFEKIYQEQLRKEKADRHEKIWEDHCPPIYRATNINDSRLSKAFVRASTEWEERGPMGLGFLGSSGKGKTRCLYVALRKAHDAMLTIRSISHNAFTKLVIDAFMAEGQARAEANRQLASLKSVKVLLIDDLGKAPSTDRCDAELEELVEHRGAFKLPILWSANGSGQWLIDKFGADRGEPLVRRLGEFSTIVKE